MTRPDASDAPADGSTPDQGRYRTMFHAGGRGRPDLSAAFMAKPFTPEELARLVRQVLDDE